MEDSFFDRNLKEFMDLSRKFHYTKLDSALEVATHQLNFLESKIKDEAVLQQIKLNVTLQETFNYSSALASLTHIFRRQLKISYFGLDIYRSINRIIGLDKYRLLGIFLRDLFSTCDALTSCPGDEYFSHIERSIQRMKNDIDDFKFIFYVQFASHEFDDAAKPLSPEKKQMFQDAISDINVTIPIRLDNEKFDQEENILLIRQRIRRDNQQQALTNDKACARCKSKLDDGMNYSMFIYCSHDICSGLCTEDIIYKPINS